VVTFLAAVAIAQQELVVVAWIVAGAADNVLPVSSLWLHPIRLISAIDASSAQLLLLQCWWQF
jgi:hypothetical protein